MDGLVGTISEGATSRDRNVDGWIASWQRCLSPNQGVATMTEREGWSAS